MKRIALPLERLLSMPRPERYIHQLAACALDCTGELVVDADSACYRQLENEYTGYEPKPEETQRAKRFVRQKVSGPSKRERLIRERQAAPGRRRGSGCGGCRGRDVRS